MLFILIDVESFFVNRCFLFHYHLRILNICCHIINNVTPGAHSAKVGFFLLLIKPILKFKKQKMAARICVA